MGNASCAPFDDPAISRSHRRRLLMAALEDWWGRALAIIPTLTAEEQADLDGWPDGSSSRRTSEWPGWKGRIEPCPRAETLRTAWFVYRLSDEDGTLLYVGSSRNPRKRVAVHRRKPWGGRIAEVRLERHPTEARMLMAELRAIGNESPLFNVVGRR